VKCASAPESYTEGHRGRTGAVLSSLIASCKRLRVEPFAYLRDLFMRISTHPHNQLDELLSDRWQAAKSTTQSWPPLVRLRHYCLLK